MLLPTENTINHVSELFIADIFADIVITIHYTLSSLTITLRMDTSCSWWSTNDVCKMTFWHILNM